MEASSALILVSLFSEACWLPSLCFHPVLKETSVAPWSGRIKNLPADENPSVSSNVPPAGRGQIPHSIDHRRSSHQPGASFRPASLFSHETPNYNLPPHECNVCCRLESPWLTPFLSSVCTMSSISPNPLLSDGFLQFSPAIAASQITKVRNPFVHFTPKRPFLLFVLQFKMK